MTISQVLRKIKKLKGEVQEQRNRAMQAVVYKEKEPPAFSFKDAYQAAEDTVLELATLEAALRQANATTTVSLEGTDITLSLATCLLAELKSKIAWLKTLPSQAQAEREVESVEYDSVSRQPYKATTKYICPFTEKDRAEAVKQAQERFDELNDLVETANHRTVVKL